MAKLTVNKNIEVTTKISKDELMSALRAITVENKDFNPDIWSLAEADTLLRAATMVRREILMKEPERYQFQLGIVPMTAEERGTDLCQAQTRGSCRTSGLNVIWWCEECANKGPLPRS